MDIAEQKLKRPFPVSKLKWRKGHGGTATGAKQTAAGAS